MGAAFKLTDAIDENIVRKLKLIGAEAETTASSYAKLVVEMGKMQGINPKGFADLEAKAAKYNETAKQLHETQEQLNKLRKEQESLLKNVASEMAKEAKIAKDLAKAKKDEAKAALDASRAKLNEAKEQKMLNKEKEKQKITMQEAIELSKKEVHSIAEAEAANKRLRQAVRDITDAEDKDGRIRKQLNATIDVNTSYIKRNRDALVQNKMTIGDYKEQIKLAMIELRNGTNTMKNFGIVAKGFGGMLKSSISGGVKEVGSSVASMVKGFVGAQAIIGGINALTTALKNGVKTAMDFEAANSTLAAILQTTADKTKVLQMQARELGATTKYTAAEATNLQVELAKLGFTTQEISNATKYVLRFAQATGSQLPEAAALTGAALRMFNADTKETERYVSAMAVATAKSALSFSYLATALPIVGPVANSFNFTIEDTLALVGKLADAGFDASMAATATRNIFLNLADANGKLATRLGEPVRTLPELVSALKKLKDEGVDLNETLELTDKRSVAAFNAFLTAAEKINPLRESITDVGDGLEAMANTMSDNTAGAVKTLESAWEELMISIYGNTTAIRAFVETCTEGVRWITNLVKSVEQLSDEQVAAATKIGIEAAESAISRQEEIIEASKQAYIKAGDDEKTALEKAKEERISILQSQLDEELKLRDEY
ncbi:MAG: phage tail tape measure protein, partial [Clostridia bacterium]|nr:phage tail tape measure protein [Clostridia bacterium]